MKVYIERNSLQVELIRCRKKMLNLFTFTIAKRRIQYAMSPTSAPFLTVWAEVKFTYIYINILFCSRADEEMIKEREKTDGPMSACNLLLYLLPRKIENYLSHFVAALHKNGHGRIADDIEPAFRKTRKENVRV